MRNLEKIRVFTQHICFCVSFLFCAFVNTYNVFYWNNNIFWYNYGWPLLFATKGAFTDEDVNKLISSSNWVFIRDSMACINSYGCMVYDVLYCLLFVFAVRVISRNYLIFTLLDIFLFFAEAVLFTYTLLSNKENNGRMLTWSIMLLLLLLLHAFVICKYSGNHRTAYDCNDD